MPDGSNLAASLPSCAVTLPASDHPDAEVIRLCGEYADLERRWNALDDESRVVIYTPEMRAIDVEQEALLGRMLTLGSSTLEGLRALAGILADAQIAVDDPSGGASDRLPGLIIRSLIQGVDASPRLLSTTALTSSNGDATLLAACAEFDAAERQYLAVFEKPRRTTRQEDAAGAKACRIQAPLLDVIQANPPTTMDGFVAVARSLELWDRELLKPGTETGEVLTAVLVRALLETSARSSDVPLLALCAEFLQVHYDREDKAEGPNAIIDDDAFEAVNMAACERMNELAGKMEAVPPTTEAGVLAVLRCVAAAFGEMAVAFDVPDTTPYILLKMALQGAQRVAVGPALPNPDAALLAMRPEYHKIMSAYEAANRGEAPWADVEDSGAEFNDFCDRIAAMPAAVTREGRALQAICALRQLSYIAGTSDGEEHTGAEGVVWNILVAQVDGLYPLPGQAASETDDPVEADASLLALKPEFEKLHEELQAALEKNPTRGGKRVTQRKFDEVIAHAVRMPQARSAAGLQFQKKAQYLAQARGVEIIRETRV